MARLTQERKKIQLQNNKHGRSRQYKMVIPVQNKAAGEWPQAELTAISKGGSHGTGNQEGN